MMAVAEKLKFFAEQEVVKTKRRQNNPVLGALETELYKSLSGEEMMAHER